MPVVNYHEVNGEIIGETTVGQPRVDYLTDALGSITATVNQSAQVVNTYRYKPFGALLAKTGPGPDPAFGWCGTHGCKPTGNKFCDFNLIFRNVDSMTARFPTQDPMGYYSGLNKYQYVESNPTNLIDPTGLYPPIPGGGFLPGPIVYPFPPGTHFPWPSHGGPHGPIYGPIAIGYPPQPPITYPGPRRSPGPPSPPVGPGGPGSRCLALSPGACFLCFNAELGAYVGDPNAMCHWANYVCHSHAKCNPLGNRRPGGGGCPTAWPVSGGILIGPTAWRTSCGSTLCAVEALVTRSYELCMEAVAELELVTCDLLAGECEKYDNLIKKSWCLKIFYACCIEGE